MAGVSTNPEASMYGAAHYDMQLGDFLKRPVKIAEVKWGEGSILSSATLNPWKAFLTHESVLRKTANFKLIRGDMHVKFVINGSPFLFGKLLVSYAPLSAKDVFSPLNETQRLCRISQRPHIYVNPTTSSGGQMMLPFFYPYNSVHIPLREFDDIGTLYFTIASELHHAAGKAAECTMSVFAWMENVTLSQPTAATVYNQESFSAQSGEESKKVVSKVATGVGTVAGALSNTPVIGPYARATAEVANRLGRLADLFGFSKPIATHEMAERRVRYIGTFAPTNDKDQSRVLALDVKHEHTIDPGTVGLTSIDEMSIPYLCNKECLLTSFKWASSSPPEEVLLRIPVTPYIKASFPTDGLVDLPPMGYLATFFKYWRGSIDYRLIVNASRFHRGKLRIKYEPYPYYESSGNDYNVVQSEIIDICDNHDFTFKVGWGSNRSYLELCRGHQPCKVGDLSEIGYSNGNIVVSVANPLIVPDDDAHETLEVLVAIKGCEDIQFAHPIDQRLTKYTLHLDNDTTAVPPPAVAVYAQPVAQAIGNMVPIVFYYGWHTNNFHNSQDYLRRLLVSPVAGSNMRPNLAPEVPVGEYDDTSNTVVDKQLSLMQSVGINHVCFSWWGQDRSTDRQFRSTLGPRASLKSMNTFALIEMLEFIPKDSEPTFSDWKKLDDNIKFFKSFIANTPSYWSISGKPVIFLYVLRAYEENIQIRILDAFIDIFENTTFGGYASTPFMVGDICFGSPKRLNTFLLSRLSAISAYDVYGQTSPKLETTDESVLNYHLNLASWKTLNPNVELWPTISPGYNDTAVRGGNVPLSRNLKGYDKGSLLKAHLKHMEDKSDQSHHRYFINSWNEWHEDTQIEPVVQTTGSDETHAVPDINTFGITYEPYDKKYLNILGNYQVSSFVPLTTEVFKAQSGEEMENEIAPEGSVETVLASQNADSYHPDDLIYFGERVASVRTMIKRYYLNFFVNANQSVVKIQFPQFPKFRVTDITMVAMSLEHMLNRIGVLFLGRRGSVRYKVLFQTSATAGNFDYPAFVELGDSFTNTTIISVDQTIAFPRGWNGMDATDPRNNALEYQVPCYSNKRFQMSRSLDRSEEISHWVTTPINVKQYGLYAAAGDDLQFFHFIGTPALNLFNVNTFKRPVR